MSVSKLLSGVEAVSEEVSSHDLEVGGTGGFINECGVYPVTVEKAFMSNTKKGGIQLDLHFGGANSFQTTLYIVSMKNKKLVTTCEMKGKTVSLPDFKMFKQIMFLATGVAQDLNEINTENETIKYKAYGKDVTVKAETLVDLIGKTLNIGVRLEEQYNYEDGETDKTSLKVNQNGDVVYKKSLESVFNESGLDAQEVISDVEEGKAIVAKRKFLEGDKGIKRVKLELPEIDETEEPEDELDF